MPNPNLPPTHNLPPGHIDGLSEPLQIYSIESLRDQQDDMLTNALDQEEVKQGRPLTDPEKDAIRSAEYAKYDGEIEAYLNAHGIDPAHPDFATYRDKLRELSIDRVSPSDWNVFTVDPNDSSNILPSPRDQAMNDMATNFTAPVTPPVLPVPAPAPPTPPVPPMPPTPPTPTGPTPAQNPAHMALDEARAELARVSAKRQTGLNIYRSGSKREEFDASKREYEARLTSLIRDELQKEIAAGNYPDEADQRLYVAARVMDNYIELQKETNANIADSRMSKFIDFMTRGGRVARIIKGAGLGAAAGLVGLGITTATGGAAAAGVAAGVAAAARMARGYATFDARAGRGVELVPNDDAAKVEALQLAKAENETADRAIDLLSADYMDQLEIDTKSEIKKRWKSLGKAAALVAGGAAAVELVHYGYDAMTSHGPSGTHTPGSGASHADKPGGPGTTHPEPGTVEPQAPKPIEYSSDAYRISPGEGFYQTFQDMDIPQKDWSGLLERVGPQLHDMQVDGHSLAYRMPNGEWGIRMTADGKMPQGALDAITHAHDQMTGHVTGGGASGTEVSSGGGGVEVPSTSSAMVVEAPGATTVNPSEISGLMQQTDISAADIQGNSAMEALTHVSPNLSPEGLGQRLNLPASEWARLQEYIIGETNGGNKLYTSAFSVNSNGYLRFTGNQIPAGTMADMLTHISPTVRYGLAA